MSKVVTFTDNQIDGLSALGIAIIYAELGDDGSVYRELGLDAVGTIVHRHPGRPTVARHGLFDLQSVEGKGRSEGDMSAAQFAALWEG